MVEEFFQNVRLHESFADHGTRIWLAELPFHMRENAIPLFVDEDDSERGPEDYQLHPSYTSLELDKSAKQPDGELFCLTNDEKKVEVPSLVIGIGRLFVNTSDGEAGRTSKWTGYEVLWTSGSHSGWCSTGVRLPPGL